MRRLTCCEVNGTRCFGADQHAYVCQLRLDECYLLGSMGLLHRPVQDNLNMQNLAMYQCYSIQYSVHLSALPFQHALNDQISFSLSQNTFLQWQLVFLASAKEGAITLTFGRRTSLIIGIGKFSFIITTFLTQHLSTLPWTSALQADVSIEWLVEIHVIQAPGRIERLTRQLSFVAEILFEPTAVRHQPSEVHLLHRDAPPVLATVWLLHWFCYLSIQDC